MEHQTFVGDEASQQKAQSFIDLVYETSDGYISVAVQSDKQWQGLVAALDKSEWLEDERFKTVALRELNINARLALIQEALLGQSSDYWLERLEAADVPCAPVLQRRDVITHPQVIANEILMENDHPHAGVLRQARSAARFSHTPAGYRYGAPLLGEHSREVLSGLGYDKAEIDRLVEAGIVGLSAKGRSND